MQALFTGGLGDFIGAECFMTEEEKDAVTTVLWATRNSGEIKAAVDLKTIFPNMKEDRELYTDWALTRPEGDWVPGTKPFNIGMKNELNTKCNRVLTQDELDAISDHSLDGTLQDIFQGRRQWVSSRFATRNNWENIERFRLPQRYVAIHPWSDAEINGREFDDNDWNSIFSFLNMIGAVGVVVNRSDKPAPAHPSLIDLTNRTSLKETFAIIKNAESCILCASSLACYATKIFPIHRIWLKGGWDHMFSEWATYFYHGPFTKPNDIIFKNMDILKNYSVQPSAPPPTQTVSQFPTSFMTNEKVKDPMDLGVLTLL